ncbi:kynurenine--oxoglutarate transaminase 3-like [Contarinia nasturtii]|uniref:kynurenine--oxoglutarate transaminase 3-like n=1 Tax=Contarinia nasturtii TaxID=265458 RepID=UPI0012D3CAC1|nr:kynurenine--oxoglutarate transaminase 3-like [Contarinia nasturtii]
MYRTCLSSITKVTNRLTSISINTEPSLRKMSNQSIADKFQLPKRWQGSTQSVWNEYTQLFLKYQPLSLAHGFTDSPVPKYITQQLAIATQNADHMLNQYARDFGHPRLVNVLSSLYSKLINRTIDPDTEVLITAGAYEALYASIHSHIDEGDEVIIIEPAFDSYEPVVKMCGGVVRYIPLRLKNPASDIITSADYVLDDAELEAVFNDKTKIIVINTPNNPCGKVFSREELTKIANLCKKYNVICVMDEVYEWMVYDDNEHVRICSLPGMWERTITIGSAGKALAVTGWKTGWALGPPNLISHLHLVHQNCVASIPTPLQEAIATVFEVELKRLDSPECYFNVLRLELQVKRDFMINVLKKSGMQPIIPQGGYFIIADWSALEDKVDLSQEPDAQKDYKFTKWMIKNIGLQAIPPTAFFNAANKSLMENCVRFCFVRKEENLHKAADILKKWTGKM